MKIVYFSAFILTMLAAIGYSFSQNTTITVENGETIPSLVDTNKDVTNIIVVHGIGNHCVGYADSLIDSIMTEVSDHEWSNATVNYMSYLRDSIKNAIDQNIKNESENLYVGNDVVYFPRSGGCKIDKTSKESIDMLLETYESAPTLINETEIEENRTNKDGLYKTDIEILVNGQDDLCKYIYNESIDNSEGGNNVSCYKLTVDYINRHEEKVEYIVGFIRKITSQPAVSKQINIYELTWNPATRWLKKSFNISEGISEKAGAYKLNQELKSQVVNSAIADAIAYLSDSGILVNYNLLQTFCLTYLGDNFSPLKYKFRCSSDLLRNQDKSFQLKNDVILISHSLGTRIVLDTLGLLSIGISEGASSGLMAHIHKKFNIIGAEVPDEYLSKKTEHIKGFSGLLFENIPDFIKSIRTLYVFTNQIPLLAANISSPFDENHELGAAFSNFLEIRDRQLKVVSFHDPDDLLSYNLRCWYQNTILKEMKTTKDIIDLQAMTNAADNNSDIGIARTKIRDAIFSVCKKKDLDKKTDKILYGSIWDASEKKLKLINVAVRLKSDWSIPGTFSDPSGIHSNYFTDKDIHNSFLK